MKNIYLCGVVSFAFLVPQYAQAQDLFHFSAGYYDVLDDQDGVDIRAEYRPDNTFWLTNLKPFAGLEVTSQGSVWGGGGILYDYKFAPQWYATPSVGAGLYTDGGSDVDLDYPVQFRTGLEISYAFENEDRLSVGISHMSNAGLGDSNPGVETVSVGYNFSF